MHSRGFTIWPKWRENLKTLTIFQVHSFSNRIYILNCIMVKNICFYFIYFSRKNKKTNQNKTGNFHFPFQIEFLMNAVAKQNTWKNCLNWKKIRKNIETGNETAYEIWDREKNCDEYCKNNEIVTGRLPHQHVKTNEHKQTVISSGSLNRMKHTVSGIEHSIYLFGEITFHRTNFIFYRKHPAQ